VYNETTKAPEFRGAQQRGSPQLHPLLERAQQWAAQQRPARAPDSHEAMHDMCSSRA
jgi:hypothetical protein